MNALDIGKVVVRNIFLTGANRGIGFHLLKKMVLDFNAQKIFATYRDPSKSQEFFDFVAEHKDIVVPVQLDVRDFDNYPEVVKLVEDTTNGQGLNLLINNAGITSKVTKISAIRRKELVEGFEVNTIAPIMLTKALLHQLEAASAANPKTPMGIQKAAVINISSILGSIESNDQGGMYAYRCSKAALNAATRSMSLDFQKSHVMAVSIHPGWVQTDMGGPRAPINPEESTLSIIVLLKGLQAHDNGQFLQWDGTRLPW